ncbi:MAG: hypothetical protein ACLP41_06435, partial [Acidimicrobiales bacterium]
MTSILRSFAPRNFGCNQPEELRAIRIAVNAKHNGLGLGAALFKHFMLTCDLSFSDTARSESADRGANTPGISWSRAPCCKREELRKKASSSGQIPDRLACR